MNDYYAILNVDPTSGIKEIKKAYRQQASLWHPDRNNSLGAKERMQLIIEAKLILLDHEARAKYDLQYHKFKEASVSEDNIDGMHTKNFNQDEMPCSDETLNIWIRNARKQALSLVALSFEDLVDVSKEAASEVWDKTKYMIAIVVIANVILAILY